MSFQFGPAPGMYFCMFFFPEAILIQECQLLWVCVREREFIHSGPQCLSTHYPLDASISKQSKGLLRWLSDKEPTCQTGDREFQSLDQEDPLETEMATFFFFSLRTLLGGVWEKEKTSEIVTLLVQDNWNRGAFAEDVLSPK